MLEKMEAVCKSVREELGTPLNNNPKVIVETTPYLRLKFMQGKIYSRCHNFVSELYTKYTQENKDTAELIALQSAINFILSKAYKVGACYEYAHAVIFKLLEKGYVTDHLELIRAHGTALTCSSIYNIDRSIYIEPNNVHHFVVWGRTRPEVKPLHSSKGICDAWSGENGLVINYSKRKTPKESDFTGNDFILETVETRVQVDRNLCPKEWRTIGKLLSTLQSELNDNTRDDSLEEIYRQHNQRYNEQHNRQYSRQETMASEIKELNKQFDLCIAKCLSLGFQVVHFPEQENYYGLFKPKPISTPEVEPKQESSCKP